MTRGETLKYSYLVDISPDMCFEIDSNNFFAWYLVSGIPFFRLDTISTYCFFRLICLATHNQRRQEACQATQNVRRRGRQVDCSRLDNTYHGSRLVSVRACEGGVAVCQGEKVLSPDIFADNGQWARYFFFPVSLLLQPP